MRRGWVYTIAVLNENGDDGRLIVDGRTGEPIRFIPAMRVDARLNEELDSMYGPPGPPPAAFASDPYMRRAPRPPASIPKVAKTPAAQPHVQTAAKPTGTPESAAAAAPKAAPAVAAVPASAPVTAKDTSQLPAETGKSDAAKSDAAKSDAAKSDTAKSDTKQAETVAQVAPAPSPSTTGQAKPDAAKPADGKPAQLQLKPTQEMPPVQPLD
jgi:hypothetical protein